MTITKTPFAVAARVQFVLRICGARPSAISRPAYRPRREAAGLLARAIIAPSSVEIHRASINGIAGEPTLASPSESAPGPGCVSFPAAELRGRRRQVFPYNRPSRQPVGISAVAHKRPPALQKRLGERMVRPSALAVLRLMTSSNLVAN